ncbi:MAG TPA: adenylate/guanylate cyclase domain-containing protein [Syntrophorhabdales bacterium]|nr:adenylate/guanylate cyclase domain-containing protein [Syntrophorhabdales bacterium]
MTIEKFKRKLTAILSADVKGYSRLMGEDEEGTIRTLNAYLGAVTGFIQKHQGRLVVTAGDSVLAEFASVVDAVRCAVEIQEELKDRNKELAEAKRMEFRIGVNLGDVVEEGNTILGDGVNVAARVQSLAEAGGICISGMVYENIKNKLAFGYEYVGEQLVKNIKEPVKIYRVVMQPGLKVPEAAVKKRATPRVVVSLAVLLILAVFAGIAYFSLRPSAPRVEVASKEKMAFPLPDKPSIAVLPFVNMSKDPEQEYLADGFAEAIIDGLSKCPHIVVIARNSTFVYKGKPVKVQQVAEDLGVRNVLEGSLQKTGDMVRITVQLIDALTGQHLFSERYDRELKNILVLQDEITMKILAAVQVTLTAGEDARLRAKGTTNLEAYLKLMQARQYLQMSNKEASALARQLTEQAIALDPSYATAYATLCIIQQREVILGVYKNPREALQQAIKLGEKAITLDDSNALAHANLARTYQWLREYDKAVAEAEKAVSLDPNSAYAYHALGSALDWAGRSQEAIPFLKKSLRLSPMPIDSGTLIRLGNAYHKLGQYEEAVASYKKALQVYGADHLMAHLGLASTYALMGREQEAHREAAEVLRIDPTFSVESLAGRYPLKDQKARDDYVSSLRKAGLK